MFRPNWPSSGVQVVLIKESAAHCNAGFFLLRRGLGLRYAGDHQFYIDVILWLEVGGIVSVSEGRNLV
jgi:hypothetical protein